MTQESTNTYASNSNGTGTINYNIGNDLSILASKDTYSMTSETETKNAGGSVGNNAIQLNYGQSESNSRIFSTTYNNVDIIGNNINIKTGNNTDIKGANVLAQAIVPNHSPLEGESNEQGLDRSSFGGGLNIGGNINMDIGNNLNIESLQDSYYAKSKSSSFGISAGGGKGKDGGANGNAGFNFGKTNSTTDSQWVSQQTSIIGDNNVNIRTNNNTNLIGSVVASNTNNLTLNTGSLTYSDLNDFYKEETKGYNFGTSVGGNTDKGKANMAPNGSTTIGLTHTGQEKEQITRATIGNGSIVIANNSDISNLNRDVNNSQEITKDMITGALNGSMTIDNRVFTSDGRSSIANDFKNLGKNTAITITAPILNVTDVVSVVINKITGDKSDKSIIQDWKDTRISTTQKIKAYSENYDRRKELTEEGYKYYENLEKNKKKEEFELLKPEKSIYHTYPLDENGEPIRNNFIITGEKEGYEKYIHKEKGYEVVVDKNGKPVTNATNIGTYNHFNPGGLTNNIAHTILDVIPYFFHGNDEKILPDSSTPTDKTWAPDRIIRTLHKPQQNEVKK